ncbi:SGT1 [Macleaya cordata]|uniref:SGT1 n=1 Tax=Macleaya cordata TaxID=56857 RepID=A0A200PUF7_MACCD|nr:SGT1 [Macleaya cordata]
MDRVAEAAAAPSSSSRIPEDTVFYAIYPDLSLQNSSSSSSSSTLNEPENDREFSSSLHSLHLQILDTISPYTTDYIWQHEPFTLSLSSPNPNPNCPCSTDIRHFHGKTKYGDNLEDEWFIVFLLFEISRKIPDLSIQVWDTDGEFLLIEAAFYLPRWLNPETSKNRVFIRRGELNIVPKQSFPSNPKLSDALFFIAHHDEEVRAPDSVQLALKNRISGYPERARSNMHQVRVRVPVSVAKVLKHEPCLISLAVEGFYDRDIDSMKFAAKMEKFLSGGTGEELVQVTVRMSRAMYAQLVQQTFQAPKCYPMPPRTDSSVYTEAELGMKITCGFEMMYQQRRHEGLEVKGSSWEAFKESLESSGYFKELLPGSQEYRRLMQNAQEYYRNSSLFSRASEMMNAPVRRIDEILALPHSAEEFKGLDLPPSDDDGWLYNGEDELKSAMLERQKEMELYELKSNKSQKAKEQKEAADTNLKDSDLGDIVKSMQSFVHKVSSYEGAEVPVNRDSNPVDLDVERFLKDMESVMGQLGGDDADVEGGSSSDMDFDESEDASDLSEDENRGDTFMDTYSDALNAELKATTLKKSFVRANEQPSRKDNEGTSNVVEEMEDEFTPVDVDVNLVKSLLDSFSSQQGLPGPASNLLGLMGLQLPQDASKDK